MTFSALALFLVWLVLALGSDEEVCLLQMAGGPQAARAERTLDRPPSIYLSELSPISAARDSFGPGGCVTLSLSGRGTCVIRTQCRQSQDLGGTDFSFLCDHEGVTALHSYGRGGFERSEVFDTGVRCSRCSSFGAVQTYGPGGCISTFRSEAGTCVVRTQGCDATRVGGLPVPFGCRDQASGATRLVELAPGSVGLTGAVDSRQACASCEAPPFARTRPDSGAGGATAMQNAPANALARGRAGAVMAAGRRDRVVATMAPTPFVSKSQDTQAPALQSVARNHTGSLAEATAELPRLADAERRTEAGSSRGPAPRPKKEAAARRDRSPALAVPPPVINTLPEEAPSSDTAAEALSPWASAWRALEMPVYPARGGVDFGNAPRVATEALAIAKSEAPAIAQPEASAIAKPPEMVSAGPGVLARLVGKLAKWATQGIFSESDWTGKAPMPQGN